MRIGVIGAGATGLTAAFDLARHGHDVTVLEAADEIGGLAGSLVIGGTPVERYYHHLFASDRDMISLISELGLGHKMRWYRPTTGVLHDGSLYPFGTPLEMLRFQPLGFPSRLRFAASSSLLKLDRNGMRFREQRALDWSRRFAGRPATEVIWEPLLYGKFGDLAGDVAMSWLWARVSSRTFRLGYLDGGFHQVYQRLTDEILSAGGALRLGWKLAAMSQPAGSRDVVVTNHLGDTETFERVLFTAPPGLLHQAIERGGGPPAPQRSGVRFLGAMAFILELDHSLTPYYWINVGDRQFPFLAIVEHTRMVDRQQYGGRHVVYLGNYLPTSDWRYTSNPDEVLHHYMTFLTRIQPDFDPSWVLDWHVSKAPFAQPVVDTSYHRSLPAHETPLQGVLLATMAQVYPYDRGQNYAVAMARSVIKPWLSDGLSVRRDS